MKVKLILKLDKDTIDKAKEFAQKRNTSLSRIVESFLNH
jgi:hypothetical protein